MTGSEPLLSVRGLVKHFPVKKGLLQQTVGRVHAVDGISFDIGRGETLGLVGESGCGKSTAGKAILKLIEPTAGEVRVDGTRIDRLSRRGMRPFRRQLQVVFQDPYSSLNPRLRIRDIIGEPLRNYGIASGAALEARVSDLAAKVGLREEALDRYPHEFSGGQRQRIGIARALALNPSLIICDEPVSALDVSVQAQVINLLGDLQRELGLSYLFIAHDIAVVEHISHRIAVMYLGKIVELADKTALFKRPLHPYTEALLSAVPVPEPGAETQRIILRGDVPSPINPPSGCRFHTRCPYAFGRCSVDEPPMIEVAPGHHVACHLRDAEPEGEEPPASILAKGATRAFMRGEGVPPAKMVADAAESLNRVGSRVMTARIAEFGVTESGAYNFYNIRVDRQELLDPVEIALADFLAALPPFDAYHEVGAGLGMLAMLIALTGRNASAIELDPRRQGAAEAVGEAIAVDRPEIKTRITWLHGEFPGIIDGRDLGNSLAIFTNFVVTVDEVGILDGIFRYRAALIDIDRFGRMPFNDIQRRDKLLRLRKAGFRTIQPALDLGKSGRYYLVSPEPFAIASAGPPVR